jgi:S1-C subfamily serine protease
MANLIRDLSKATESVVESARRSIVCVGNGKAQPRTGVVIESGKVATIAVMAEPGETVPIDGPGGTVQGTVIGFDRTSGVALLDAPGLDSPVEAADIPPAVGQLGVEVAVPIPGGHEARLAMVRCVGKVTRLPGGRRIDSYYQTDVARFRGFSGAVLLDAGGAALGISMSGGRREEPVVLPIAELQLIARQIESGERIGTAYLGLKTSPVELPHKSDAFSEGLIVTGVEAGSPAEQAGVVIGEFLVAIDDAAVTEVDSLYDALHARLEGSMMELTIMTGAGELKKGTVEVEFRS